MYIVNVNVLIKYVLLRTIKLIKYICDKCREPYNLQKMRQTRMRYAYYYFKLLKDGNYLTSFIFCLCL